MASLKINSVRRRPKILTTPAGIRKLDDSPIQFHRQEQLLDEIDDDQLIPRAQPVAFSFSSPKFEVTNQPDIFTILEQEVEQPEERKEEKVEQPEERKEEKVEQPEERKEEKVEQPEERKEEKVEQPEERKEEKVEPPKKYVVRVSKKLIDVSTLSPLERETLRSDLTIRLKDLSNNPKLKITPDEYSSEVPLEALQIRYESYNEYNAIEREKEKYRLYLGFIWFFIQGILKKMNMPIEGYIEQQIRQVGFYDFILTPMAEKDYLDKQQGSEREEDSSSLWMKIIFQSLVNAIILLGINFFFSGLGSEQRRSMTSTIIDYLSGSPGENGFKNKTPEAAANSMGGMDLGQLVGLATPFITGLLNPKKEPLPTKAPDDYELPFSS